jgi:hypothetical protein
MFIINNHGEHYETPCIKNSQGEQEYPTNNKKKKVNWIGHILPSKTRY